MTKKNLFFIIILIISSCQSDSATEDSTFKKTSRTSEITDVVVIDSIPLFNKEYSFQFFETSKLSEDTLLAFNYPLLNLCYLNKKGDILKSIGKKDDGPNSFYDFILPLYLPSGELAVLIQGPDCKLLVYDKDFNFAYKLPICNELDGFYISIASSHALISPSSKSNQLELILNLSSDRYSVHSRDYYLNTPFVSKIVFDLTSQEIIEKKSLFQFTDIPLMAASLKKGEKRWMNEGLSNFSFIYENGFYYFKPSFAPIIYQMDTAWQVINQWEIELAPIGFLDGYAISFEDMAKDTGKRLSEEKKLFESNITTESLCKVDNKIYFTYQLTKNPNSVEAFDMAQSIAASYPIILFELDLVLGTQRYKELPSRFLRSLRYDGKNLWISGRVSEDDEDRYLYKLEVI